MKAIETATGKRKISAHFQQQRTLQDRFSDKQTNKQEWKEHWDISSCYLQYYALICPSASIIFQIDGVLMLTAF